jgi:putative SOS response-associated peptidase YedK
MAGRMFKRLLASKSEPAQPSTNKTVLPKPVQLALPLLGGADALDAAQLGEHALSAAPLFREARRVEPVLSYERASLEQIVPNSDPAPDTPHDRLILPGGTGLVLYEDKASVMAFAWMQWGRKSVELWKDGGGDSLGATVDAQELRKTGRAARRLTRHRCIIPLTRYSVPVHDEAMWSHKWISPANGPVVCVAGVWTAERGAENRFAMVTGLGDQDADGPLILAEDELLLWLRAPLADALAALAERHAGPEGSTEQ